MDKWFIILIAMALVGISVYGVSSWVNLINQDQQARNEAQQNENEALQLHNQKLALENQAFIKKQIINESQILENKIEDKFDELDEKRNIAANKTQNVIIDTQRDTLNNLTGHISTANDTNNVAVDTQNRVIDLGIKIDNNTAKSLENQENYFAPYFNESFQKLFKALEIEDTGSNFSLIGPRK